jgi:excisionase family DNA binding protein
MSTDNITLLKPSQVMERLGVSRGRLYGWIADGTLPCVRLGRSVRIPAVDLAAWIEERRRESGLPAREEPELE